MDNKKKMLDIINDSLMIEQQVGYESIDLPLNEYGVGLSSIEYVTLLTEIEKKLGIQIADEDWNYNKLPTLRSILNYIEKIND